ALTRALDDLCMHLDRVARAQCGHFLLLLLLFELLDDVHDSFNSLIWTEDLSAASWRRHCLMRAWSPERSTSGTINPRSSAGRVNCGHPAANSVKLSCA